MRRLGCLKTEKTIAAGSNQRCARQGATSVRFCGSQQTSCSHRPRGAEATLRRDRTKPSQPCHVLVHVAWALVLLTGCQSSFVFHTSDIQTPPDIASRLAAIEAARLDPAHDRLGRATAGVQAEVAANRAVSLSVQRAVTSSSPIGRDAIWTMTDFADADLSEDSQSDTGFASRDLDETFGRRPPLESFWETVKRDLKYMPDDLWQDTKRVYTNPVNLVILGSAYGGSVALQKTGPDDTVEDHYRGRHHHFKKEWREAFAAVGNPGTHFGLAGLWYLVGQQTGNEKTYEVGKTMFSALIINGLTVMLGQTASWDRSPNGELGTFPSGHTSSSFVMASVLHEAYGHLVGIPLYGLATLVAIERVEDGEHYFSDVIMGAALGTVIGHSVASGKDPEFFGWKVVPYVSPGGSTGVALMKTM